MDWAQSGDRLEPIRWNNLQIIMDVIEINL